MADTDPLSPGTSLGSYTVRTLLGRGGMGSVYLAFDTTLHRLVALKVVSGADNTSVSRPTLLREARSAAALNHPNICTIYEVGEAGGSAFIAMEYVEGRSLRDRLDAGPLVVDEAVRWGLQAADALDYAHAHGVVHRDFKAANVIVTADGRLKVVDFGLASRRDPAMTEATTMQSLAQPGKLFGTPYAMAPEQVRGAPSDARTDIWALGILLYEMLSGSRPFSGETTPELFSAILRDAPKPLPQGVPGECRQVVERCLSKEPDGRYQSASDIRGPLESAQTAAVLAAPSGRQRPLAQRPWLWMAAAVVTAAVAAVSLNVGSLRDRLTGGLSPSATITMAILPLENLTGDSGQDYLSDGVTEGLIAALSRRQSSRFSVVPRGSSMGLKKTALSVSQIGSELGADTILKGSIERSGERVRVSTALVSASNAREVWHDTFEAGSAGLFSLEREIADAVASALRLPPTEPATKAGADTRQLDPAAYDLYLRGLSHAFRNNEQDIDQAIALFEQAAAIAPTFVPGQAYLAMVYGLKAANYRANEPQWEEKGFAAAQKALALDPNAPEAHFALGTMLWRPSHGFPSREALAEFRKALAAQPNLDEAWHQHGVVLLHVGHMEAAAREIENALRINPGNTVARFRFAPIYNYQQKFDDAIAALDRVPKDAYTAQWMYHRAWALISLGRLDEAGTLLDEALKNNPVDQGGVLHSARGMLRAKRGDVKGAEADIAEAIRVGRNYIHFHHTAYSIGAIYSVLGRLDEAEKWIEEAANSGFPNYTFYEADVHLSGVRTRQSFRDRLARMRQEWEHIPGEPD